MPIYLGHPNNKDLAVSPGLQTLGINLLRAAPNDVRILANPRVVQDGYSSYVSHIAAFMSAYVKQQAVPTSEVGYPVSLEISNCFPIRLPNLVISFKGQVPTSALEKLNIVGFERTKVNKKDDILVFSDFTFDEAREILGTNPIRVTPAPAGAVNLQAFTSFVVVLKVLSNFLRAHTYPAFADEDHLTDVEAMLEVVHLEKRAADEHKAAPPSKKAKVDDAVFVEDEEMEDTDTPSPPKPKKEIHLKRAKPPAPNNLGWGTPSQIPNTSGLFFPFVPELASFDNKTVPDLIDDFFLKALGKTPENQVQKSDEIRSAWGVVSKTETGNILAHIAKIVNLALRSQTRAFPLISDGVYHGSILSGARFYLGHYGKVVYPITYGKIQEETSSYQFHTKVLRAILNIVDEKTDGKIEKPTTMRGLRALLLDANLSEENRDEIRRLAVHLNFKEKFLGLNAQTIIKLLNEFENLAEPNDELPLHPNALFSQDAIFVALSAFGYQAPSPMIDSCPKIKVTGTPPQTLVFRQKPVDLATLDWKKILETKEITNNPRNLSRQNRDRSMTGNDKTTVWGKMVETMSAGGKTQTEQVDVEVVAKEDSEDIGAF